MFWRCRFSRPLYKALCLLIVFACPQVSAQVENGAIAGQITVSRASFPPERIELTLQTRGIVVSEVWTDTEGKFLFRDLPGNLYHISIRDDKYEPYDEEVKVDPRINPVNILSISLTPRAQEKADTHSPSVRGNNPYLLDPAEYKKRFPKKAVKEFERGSDSQAKGEYDEAVQYFQSSLKLAPDFYPAHNNLGTTYLAQRHFSQAQSEFEAVLKLNQNDTEAYFNLGNVFLLTQRHDEALQMVEEGLRRQPNSGFGQFLRGSIYARLGRRHEAESALRDAIRLDPSLARAHLELVNLYLRDKRTQEAAAELKYFLKSFPGDPLVPHAREVLVRLESSNRGDLTTR